MDQLAQYVKSQLSNGYSREQIQQVLLQQGYTQSQVDGVFSELGSASQQPLARSNSSPQQSSSYQQLYNYIYQTLASGYPAEQLYSYLLQQGYDKKLVRQAFTQLHNQYQTQMPQSIVHTHELSSSTITKVGVMIIVVAVLIGGFFFLLQGLGSHSKSVKLLQVELDLVSNQLKSGSDLQFQVNSINEGDPGLVDIQFKYVITDAADRVVDDWLDSKAFQTRMQFIEHYDLLDFPPGNYKLSVSAFYGSQQSSSAYRKFVVLEDDEEPDSQYQDGVVDLQEEDQIPTSNDNQELGVSDEDDNSHSFEQDSSGSPEVIVPDTDIKSDDDLLDQALHSSSAEEMAGYCKLISAVSVREQCYLSVSEQYVDLSYCSLIETETIKEDCYVNLVLLNNLDACKYVTLSENVNLCNELIQVQGIQDYLNGGSSEVLQNATGISPYNVSDTNASINESELSLDDFDISDFV